MNFIPLAHVKWFTDSASQIEGGFFMWHEPALQVGIVVLLILLGLAFALDHWAIKAPEKLEKWGKKNGEVLLWIAQILVGFSLIITALKGAILAPHYAGPASLAWLEGGVGLLLILNIAVNWAAAGLVVLYLSALFIAGPLEAMEYINMLGLAIFFLLQRAPKGHSLSQYRVHALPLLRILTGAALIILAFTEKLLYPEQAADLLNQFDLNFMKALGITIFSDRLFILAAGLAETLFGLIFIAGWVTRINTAALASFLIASNLYFFWNGHYEEGWTELIGHLPVIATALLFIVHGKKIE